MFAKKLNRKKCLFFKISEHCLIKDYEVALELQCSPIGLLVFIGFTSELPDDNINVIDEYEYKRCKL